MTPTIYSKKEHLIELNDIDSEALFVLQKLQSAGFVAYLVGGGVRDLLLGRKPKDFDISTSAHPAQIRHLFKNSLLIGKRFRLAHIRFGKKIIEVSTFRSGNNEDEQLIVQDNTWGTEEEDALRRDFTINALFYDSRTETIIDYVGGYQDIKQNVLRAIGNPDIRFKQDPVRMIRLIKFAARFDFAIDPKTEEALEQNQLEIVKSSQARILEEFMRMLELGYSAPFFHLISRWQLLNHLIPHLADFLQSSNGMLCFEFLKTVDHFNDPAKKQSLPRSLLLSALIFPAIHHDIHSTTNLDNPPSLGSVLSTVFNAVDKYTQGLCKLPKKIKSSITFILQMQYRFTPISKKKLHKKKLMFHHDFEMALLLLKIRSLHHLPSEKAYRYWSHAYRNLEKETKVEKGSTRRS